MNILLANAVSLALVLAVLAYSQPLLLALLPPLALLYRWARGACWRLGAAGVAVAHRPCCTARAALLVLCNAW